MNAIMEQLSAMGIWFTQFSIGMLIQSSLLIVILLVVDRLIRKRVRAVVRYCMWMIVLVKLVLPVTLASPTGIGYWAGGSLLDDAVITASAPIESTTGGADSSTTAEKNPGEQGGSPGGTGASESTAGTPLGASQVSDVDPNATSPQRPATVSPGSHLRPGQTIVSRHKDPVITWPAVVLLAWVAVVIAMFLLLVQRWLFVRSLVAQAADAGDELAAVLDDCRRRLGIRPSARIGLKLSAGATSPAVCGLIRPVILIPSDMQAQLDSRSLRAVLLHELAHVKRLDLQVNFAQAVLQIAYFYNPLLWVAGAVIRRIREQAVDETVLVAMGDDADAYPDTLVNVAKLALARPALSLRLIGVVESKRALAGRVKHILTRPLPRSARLGAVGAICVIITAAVLLPMARADEPVALPPASKIPAAQETTDKATTQPATQPTTPPGALTAKFQWGVKVELLAVTEHFSWIRDPRHKNKKWWRPDGTIMASALAYDPGGGLGNSEGESLARQFAFRLTGLDERDIGITAHISTGDLNHSTGLEVTRRGNDELDDLKVITAIPMPGSSRIGIRFGVASGEWRRSADIKLNPAIGRMQGAAILGTPVDDNEGLHVSASDSLVERQCRIIAIDEAGMIHIGKSTGSGGASGKMRLTSVCFKGLKLKDTKRIVFQTRPYRWATFKNVSLEPGHKTKASVELSPATLGTQPPPERLTTTSAASAPNAPDIKKAAAILQRAKQKDWQKYVDIAMATGRPEPYGKNSNISINGMTEPVIEARGKMVATTKPDAEQKIEPMSETLLNFKGQATEKMIVLWPAKSSGAATQPASTVTIDVRPAGADGKASVYAVDGKLCVNENELAAALQRKLKLKRIETAFILSHPKARWLNVVKAYNTAATAQVGYALFDRVTFANKPPTRPAKYLPHDARTIPAGHVAATFYIDKGTLPSPLLVGGDRVTLIGVPNYDGEYPTPQTMFKSVKVLVVGGVPLPDTQPARPSRKTNRVACEVLAEGINQRLFSVAAMSHRRLTIDIDALEANAAAHQPTPDIKKAAAIAERLKPLMRGVLEFRVVPNAVGSSRMPVIPAFVGGTKDSFQIAAMKDLATKGPCAVNYGDSNLKLRWVETACSIGPPAIVSRYKGKNYALLCDGDRYAILPGEGKDAWSIMRAGVIKDYMNNPAVNVVFDEAGAERLEKLTRANHGNALALIVDGKVVSAPILRGTLRDSAVITGGFTQQQADDMVKALKAGVAGRGSQLLQSMKDSGILAKATEELFGEILAAQAKKSGKPPEDAKEPEFVAKFVEELKKAHPNLFRTTPTQKTAFARGEFNDVTNTARMETAIKVLENASMALPLVDIYIIDQFGAGKLKGARLEVGVRMIELTVSKMQERNHD